MSGVAYLRSERSPWFHVCRMPMHDFSFLARLLFPFKGLFPLDRCAAVCLCVCEVVCLPSSPWFSSVDVWLGSAWLGLVPWMRSARRPGSCLWAARKPARQAPRNLGAGLVRKMALNQQLRQLRKTINN